MSNSLPCLDITACRASLAAVLGTGAAVLAALALSTPAVAADPASSPMARAVQQVDTDDDQRISREEFLAAAEARFNRTDADSDGYIDSQEMREAGERRRELIRKLREQRAGQG